MSTKNKILTVTPMICTIIYLGLGFILQGDAWGWGLLIFLLVPIMPYLLGKKRITVTVTFIITVIYLVGCLISQSCFDVKIWHPAWLIFLLIPVIKVLLLPSNKKINDKIKKAFEAEYVEVDEADIEK